MLCLDPNRVLDLLNGLLAGPERSEVESHVESCDDCRTLVAEVLAESTRQGKAGQAQRLDVGARLGRFVVLEHLGAGAMGEVYSAYDPKLERRVALKLLRTEQEAGATSPLLREAKAMAQVRHPNVVAVHEASEWEGEVVLALEYVDGGTLRDWLKSPRSWREIRQRFLEAGRGLAAAHRSGITHRDFKPENVLVGSDGVARVTDFGLARAPVSAAVPGPLQASQTGALVGTPAYMAPEQLRGERADALSDQFSFCVALHEALYGVRPFAGKDAAELASAISAAAVAPRGRGVPGWLHRTVRRGLEADPSARFPSMDALLAKLEAAPGKLRWISAAAAVAGVIAIAAGAHLWSKQRALLCTGGGARVAEVWSSARRAAVREAFVKQQLPFGQDTWTRVERGLDTYARSWSAMYQEACEATRIRGEQTEELMSRRMRCLSRHLRGLGALTEVFTTADRKLVERATETVGRLPDVRACADGELLSEEDPPPPEAIRAEVDILEAEVAKGHALKTAGRYKESLEIVQAATARAERLDYPRPRPTLLLAQGELRGLMGDPVGAVPILYEGGYLADSLKRDSVGLSCWTRLAFVLGSELGRFEEAARVERLARVDLARIGGERSREAMLLYSLSAVRNAEGKYEEAKQLGTQALSALSAAGLLNTVHELSTRTNLGSACGLVGDYECSVRELRWVHEHGIVLLGPKHPVVISGLLNLSLAEAGAGETGAALEHGLAAVELGNEVLGPDHPRTGRAHLSVATALADLGRAREAISHTQEALRNWEKAFGPDSSNAAEAHRYLAEKYLKAADYVAGERHLVKAQEILKAAGTKSDPAAVWALNLLGEAHRGQGRVDEARDAYQQALALAEKEKQPESTDLAKALTGLGDSLVESRRPGEAVALLERALQIRDARKSDPDERAPVELALGKALWLSGKDPVRARALLSDALTHARVAAPEYRKWVARTRQD